MAERIIPQSLGKCNSILDIAAFLEEHGRTAEIMAALALQRSNDQARDIFSAYGGDIFIDDINMTPTSALASFLGVNHQYLQNLITRYGFRRTKMLDDYRSDHLITVLKGEKVYEINGSYIRNKKRKQSIPVEITGKQCFVSPRVALCVCFLLKYGQRIPKDSMAMKILQGCESGSSYGVEAQRIFDKKMKAIRAANDAGRDQEHVNQIEQRSDMAEASGNNDIKMTTDFFASIFKDFSHEFATAFSAEFAKAYLTMQHEHEHGTPALKAPKDNNKQRYPKKFPEKKTLPENWNKLVHGYSSGELTMRDLKLATGWCESTLRKYIKQTISV